MFNPKKVSTEDGLTLLHPFEWSDKTIAVEVETAPGKHANQVLKNFHKNTDMDYFVWFVVFDTRHKDYIENTCNGDNISPTEYSIYVLDQDSLVDNVDIDSKTIRVTSELHAVIFNILMNSGGQAAESYIYDNAFDYPQQSVKDALASLSTKGDITQKFIKKTNSDKNISVWMLSGLNKSKKIIPGTHGVDSNSSVKIDESNYIPDYIVLSPDTDDEQIKIKKNTTHNYSDMSDDLLLAIYQNNSTDDDDDERVKIVDVLKSRRLVIKRRGDSIFLSKIPSIEE